MERLGVVGITWRQGGPEALARWTVPPEERPERLRAWAREVDAAELLYLATCNRVELAFASRPGIPLAEYRPRLFRAFMGREPEPGEAERTLRAWAGEGAVEHIFLVAAGLDSARVGETEIAGQLRQALDLSRAAGLAGPRIERAVGAALRIARRVQSSTGLVEGRTSLAEIALEHVRARLAETPGRIALLGVSPMTRRAAEELASAGRPLVIVNRTLERAQELAELCRAEAQPLERFRHEPPAVEVVLSATAAEEPVLDRAALERLAARAPSGRPPLIVDMAIPPDVAPADARAAGLPRVGMAEILREAEDNRERRLHEAAEARTLVDDALLGLRRRWSENQLAPVLAAVQRRYRQTALEGVERLLSKDLAGLGERERGAVRAWAETLARRFAHLPSAGLKATARELGFHAVEVFLSRADAELARELAALGIDADAALLPDEEEELS